MQIALPMFGPPTASRHIVLRSLGLPRLASSTLSNVLTLMLARCQEGLTLVASNNNSKVLVVQQDPQVLVSQTAPCALHTYQEHLAIDDKWRGKLELKHFSWDRPLNFLWPPGLHFPEHCFGSRGQRCSLETVSNS